MVTRMDSSSKGAVKGCILLWRRGVPPPAWRESTSLSKEKSSLSEASWRVPFEEEPSMGMTSQSTRGCWIKPRNHFCPYPCRIRNERHCGKECTLREREIAKTVCKMQGDFKRGSKNSKLVVIKTQTYTSFKWRRDFSVTDKSWNDALKICTTMQSH